MIGKSTLKPFKGLQAWRSPSLLTASKLAVWPVCSQSSKVLSYIWSENTQTSLFPRLKSRQALIKSKYSFITKLFFSPKGKL